MVRDGHWSFARKGDGCIALWSWREPIWRQYGPAVAKSFAAFVGAIKKSVPSVVRDAAGFTVERLSTKYSLRGDRATLVLDFDKRARSVARL